MTRPRVVSDLSEHHTDQHLNDHDVVPRVTHDLSCVIHDVPRVTWWGGHLNNQPRRTTCEPRVNHVWHDEVDISTTTTYHVWTTTYHVWHNERDISTTTTYHVWPTTYHVSTTTYHVWHMTYHVWHDEVDISTTTTYHVWPKTYHVWHNEVDIGVFNVFSHKSVKDWETQQPSLSSHDLVIVAK